MYISINIYQVTTTVQDPATQENCLRPVEINHYTLGLNKCYKFSLHLNFNFFYRSSACSGIDSQNKKRSTVHKTVILTTTEDVQKNLKKTTEKQNLYIERFSWTSTDLNFSRNFHDFGSDQNQPEQLNFNNTPNGFGFWRGKLERMKSTIYQEKCKKYLGISLIQKG